MLVIEGASEGHKICIFLRAASQLSELNVFVESTKITALVSPSSNRVFRFTCCFLASTKLLASSGFMDLIFCDPKDGFGYEAFQGLPTSDRSHFRVSIQYLLIPLGSTYDEQNLITCWAIVLQSSLEVLWNEVQSLF